MIEAWLAPLDIRKTVLSWLDLHYPDVAVIDKAKRYHILD
jgi:hypothetical protein